MIEDYTKLNVGDEVIINGRYDEFVAKVEKVTKTTFTAGSITFNKSNGMERGADAWTFRWVKIATPEKIEEIRQKSRRKKLVNYLTNYPYDRLDDETLMKIYDMVCIDGKKEKE